MGIFANNMLTNVNIISIIDDRKGVKNMINPLKTDCETRHMTVETIYKMVSNEEMVTMGGLIDEEMRNFVITSIVCGIPLDNVYVLDNGKKQIVMDSKIIQILVDFLNNQFEYVSCIIGYPSGYYKDLPMSMKRRIKENQITLYILQEHEETMDYVVQFYRLHDKLN